MRSLLLGLLSLLFMACSGGSTMQAPDDMEKVYKPDWFLRTSIEDEQYIYVFGRGESADQNISYDEAKANATQEMAQQLEQKVETMITNMRRRHGTGENEQILKSTNTIFRSVTSTVVRGLQPDKSEEMRSKKTKKYSTWLRMRMPKKTVTDQFKAALRNEEALYTEFKEKQMLNDLDDQIEKFEKSKSN